MDTPELTDMAYEVLGKAWEAADFLRSDVAMSAAEFRTENEFLEGLLDFLKEILDDSEDYLHGWGALDHTDVRLFTSRVRSSREHVIKTLDTAYELRGVPGP